MAVSGQARIAVVLFNLGGPDRPEAVRPFLFNLFNDPAIINLPQPLRWCVAQLISRLREGTAREIYGELGGASPILPQTEEQAAALEAALTAHGFAQGRCFIAMRYWHPFADETVKAVREFNPDHVILLPLYPQFSTTTTGSSLKQWRALTADLPAQTHIIWQYPEEKGWIAAQADLIRNAQAEIGEGSAPRLLFSAHGLPKKIVDRGDPYPRQVAQTVEAVLAALGGPSEIDYEICYQSRVGPLEWIGPSTEDCLEKAGREGKSVLVIPIAFTSEHSETLVELDIEYRAVAERCGVRDYIRVATVGSHPAFIAGLADLCEIALSQDGYRGDGGAWESSLNHGNETGRFA